MRTTLSLIVAATMAGCALAPSAPVPVAASIGRYTFDYTVVGGSAVHLVQVFDDGAKTYVQFNDLPALHPLIRGSDGDPLNFERSGPYAVISGVFPRLTVAVSGDRADVINNRQAGAASPAPRPSEPASDQAVRTVAAGVEAARLLDLEDTRAELSKLKAELEATRAQLKAAKEPANPLDGRFVVRFADNSSAIEISSAEMQDLTELVAHVQGLTVTGFTDASRLTAGGSRLALRRALAVRKLLQERGMDSARIEIHYFGAGRFAADNATVDGKAANRRVEIIARRRQA